MVFKAPSCSKDKHLAAQASAPSTFQCAEIQADRLAELQRLVELVEKMRAALPETPPHDAPWEEWKASLRSRISALISALDEFRQTEKAAWSHDFRASVFRMGGIRSSSTSSLEGAVTNWLQAARKKIDQAGGGA